MNRREVCIAGVWLQLAAAPLALAAEAGGEESPSLFTGNLGQSLWTLVIFFVLLYVLAKFAWRPLLGALQNREKFIRDSLETARRDREAAEARLREYEARLAKAHEEAAAFIERGRRDGEGVRHRIEEDARQTAQEMIERAKREIGLARDTALKQLYDESVNLATSLAGNILKRQLSPEDHRRLVSESLAEIKERGNGKK